MPIAVKDYKWEQTEKLLFVSVPLKGVKPAKVDLFSTESYIKVSYPPYIFECALFDLVNDRDGSAQIGNGVVLFKLEKQEAKMWSKLHHPDTEDKKKMSERREAAITRHQEREAEEKKQKAERKRIDDKYSIQQQMNLEEEERNRMENIKQTHKNIAMAELEEWKEQQRKQAELDREEAKEKERLKKSDSTVSGTSLLGNNTSDRKKKGKKANIFDEEAGGQPLRQCGSIPVTFTPRVFPTAARESTAPQEEEWLRKNAESRRLADIEDKDLGEHEKDPVWLKDKGNQFFKAGNFQAAINAYSHAIRLDLKMPALYSNRGACHLKLGNYFKCIEDCEKALELLTPPVVQNAANRVRAHVRRGTAFCNLEAYAEGLMDYEAAYKIDPSNEQLKSDIDRIRNIIQGTSSS